MENIVKESKKEIKQNDINKFISLQDLTKQDVSKLVIVNAKFRRTINANGLSTGIKLIIEPTTMYVDLVSSMRTSNGKSRILSYFLPDKFTNILLDLELSETDKNNKQVNEWTVPVAIRFVKGKYMNSENEYHSIEVIFKQFQYHVHFLNPQTTKNLETLSAKGRLFDRAKNPYKVNWIERPEAISEIESEETEFTFI